MPPSNEAAHAERARILLAILLRHPNLLRDVEHALEELELPGPLAGLRHALLQWSEHADTLDSAALMSHLTGIGLAEEMERALSANPVPLPACAAPDAMPAEAEAGWWHIFGLMNRTRLEEEVAVANRDFVERQDATAQRRLIALVVARDMLRRGEQSEGDAPQ